jgi:prefoldin subunit 5
MVDEEVRDENDRLQKRVEGIEKDNQELRDQLSYLRKTGIELQAAIARIDTLVVPPDQAKKDTEAVGGPVGWYCVDFDHDAVVERVRKRVEELESLVTEGREALNRVNAENAERCKMKGMTLTTVFICSPYSGDIPHNIEQASKICLLAIKKGYAPFAPHLFYPRFLDDNDASQRLCGMMCGLTFLGMCDELWYLDENPSCGMRIEMEHALALNIPCIPITL